MTQTFSHRICALSDKLLVAPLARLLPGVSTIASPCAVSLFTPNAQFDPRLQPLQATEARRLSGRVRISQSDAQSFLVPVGTEEGVQLALFHRDAPGLKVQAVAPGDSMKPGWLVMQEVALSDAALSEPLDWPEDARLKPHLDRFAAAYAEEVARGCGAGLRALRRMLAELSHVNGVSSEAQLTSHAISRLEIEVRLLGDAVARPDLPAWPLLCAAERNQAAFDTLIRDLEFDLGLQWQPGAWPETGESGYFGGLRMVEGEDARRRGLLVGQA